MSASTASGLSGHLDDLGRRLARLEQLLGDPKVAVGSGSSPQFAQVTVGSAGGPQVVLGSAVSAPTSLVLAAGSFFENIYVDASWTAPADGSAVEYEVVIARRVSPGVYELAQVRRTISTALRVERLEPNATYGVRVFAIGRTGVYSSSLPVAGYQDVATGEDSTIPAQVTGLTLFSGVTTVTASWNESVDSDVRDGRGLYEVQRDTVNTFNSANLQSRRVSATVASWSGITPGTTYFVRVRAIDSSGNEGPWSATVQAQANAITSSEIAAATITGDRIAGSTITGAHVQAGSIAGDRITANTMDVNRLTTSSLTARTITLGAGGQIKVGTAGDTGGTGLLLNDQGLRLYKTSATPHIVLDALSGNGTFAGTITASAISASTMTGNLFQTALSGRRIVIDGTGALVDTVSFFPQGTTAAPGKVFLVSNPWGAAYGTDMYVRSGQATATGSNTSYSEVVVGTGNNGTSGVLISTFDGGGAGATAGTIALAANADDWVHVLLSPTGDMDVGSYDRAMRSVYLYNVLRLSANSASQRPYIESCHPGGTTRSQVTQFERHRANQTWPNAAFHDVTITWETGFVARPVVTPCVSFSGALGANASVTTFQSGTTSCSFRVHDVNNANRSGVNYDIDMWAVR